MTKARKIIAHIKKNLIVVLAVTAVAMLWSCNGNSITDEPEARVISISATVEGEEMINGSTIFVNAFATSSPDKSLTLIDNLQVWKNDNTWSYSPLAYWLDEAIDFYGYSPALGDAVRITPTTQTAQVNCDGKTDFIYAATKGLKKVQGAVNLNFRHALARVEIQLCCPDNSVAVLANGIRLRGLANFGYFKWPDASTGIGSPVIPGRWWLPVKNLEELDANKYVVAMPQPEPMPIGSEPVTINTTMCYYFIPQPLNALDNSLGALAEIDLQITDKATGARIWPTEQPDNSNYFGTAIAPLHTPEVTEWSQNKSYIYTISVGATGKLTVTARTASYFPRGW